MSNKPTEIKINCPPNLLGGNYANNMIIGYTREEFIMDFCIMALPTATVTSRVIISPGHMKRILKLLEDTIKKFEKQHGAIEAAEEPEGKIGFN